MKKFFTFMVAALAICGVACTPENNNGGGNEDGNFTIEVTEISAESAYVSVTSANDKTFYFDIVEKSELDAYTDKTEFANETVSMLLELCEYYGISFAEILSLNNDSFYYEDFFEPSTEYYAFAFNVDANGVVSGAVEYVAFKTLEGSGNTGGAENVVVDNLVFANYENYGTFYSADTANWYIQMQDYDYTNIVVVEVQTALDATSFVGTYPISNTFEAGSSVYGFLDSDSYLYGTYWASIDDDGYIDDVILAATGSVTIAEATEGYTITVDIADESGRTAKATYTGAVEPFPDETTASRYSTAVKLNKRHALKVEPKSKIKRGAALVKKMAAK